MTETGARVGVIQINCLPVQRPSSGKRLLLPSSYMDLYTENYRPRYQRETDQDDKELVRSYRCHLYQ